MTRAILITGAAVNIGAARVWRVVFARANQVTLGYRFREGPVMVDLPPAPLSTSRRPNTSITSPTRPEASAGPCSDDASARLEATGRRQRASTSQSSVRPSVRDELRPLRPRNSHQCPDSLSATPVSPSTSRNVAMSP